MACARNKRAASEGFRHRANFNHRMEYSDEYANYPTVAVLTNEDLGFRGKFLRVSKESGGGRVLIETLASRYRLHRAKPVQEARQLPVRVRRALHDERA